MLIVQDQFIVILMINRINKELCDSQDRPRKGVTLTCPNPENKYKLKAWISGPQGSVYEEGTFEIDVTLPKDYPFRCPRFRFTTKVYHPNINDNGCISIAQIDDWSPARTINSTLLLLRELLADPNPDDPLMPEIALQFKHNRQQFNRTAKEWVDRYSKN